MNLSLPKDILGPGMVLGSAVMPGSKSVSNRALLLAALAPGPSTLRGGLEAEDTRWMREALLTLGIPVRDEATAWLVEGGTPPKAQGPLWLGASGTTLRFLLPWLALRAQGSVRLQGEVRLFQRPLEPLLAPLRALGARWEPLPDGGWIHPAPLAPALFDLSIEADFSSQFLTGLALTAASLPGGGILRWKATSSASYLDLTAHWLKAFGCESELSDQVWVIPGGKLQPVNLSLPGDWSGAAAFLAAAAVTGRSIEVSPLDPRDPQGDRALITILQQAGCQTDWSGPDRLRLRGPLTSGLEANLENCPDLGPVLAAAAALAPGPSVLTGLQTLPLKECDRLEASADLVRWLGGRAETTGDHTLRIHPGTGAFPATPFDPRNDHRMAFAAAVGALRQGGELLDPDCVRKTFPAFWETWARMLLGPPP